MNFRPFIVGVARGGEVAEFNRKPDGAAASRLVADIQRGPVSVTSPGLPGRAAALTKPCPLSLSCPLSPAGGCCRSLGTMESSMSKAGLEVAA